MARDERAILAALRRVTVENGATPAEAATAKAKADALAAKLTPPRAPNPRGPVPFSEAQFVANNFAAFINGVRVNVPPGRSVEVDGVTFTFRG